MSKYPFVSESDATRAVKATGLSTCGTPKLVWGWSAETESLYYPLYQVETSVGTRFVDQCGVVTDSLNLEAPAR